MYIYLQLYINFLKTLTHTFLSLPPPSLSNNSHPTCLRMFVAPRRQSGVAHYTSPHRPTVNHLSRPRRPSAAVAPLSFRPSVTRVSCESTEDLCRTYLHYMIGQGPGSIVRKIARKYSQPLFQGLLCSRGMDLLLLCVVNVCQQFFSLSSDYLSNRYS